MNLVTLSASYLRARPLNTALNVLLLALGIATIALLMLATAQLEERMQRDARDIDLVVGAKGSPMQIILSGIYHLDVPTGNIPLKAAQELSGNRLVAKAMPLAMGDSFNGYRIVGTNADYIAHYGAQIASGRLWSRPMEAVLGAEVAARSGLAPGATLKGVHGIGGSGDEHGDSPYSVVGVLKPSNSVLDRLVLTSVESVWQVHEVHHELKDAEDRKAMEEGREVTVLLVKYASPLAAATLPRFINGQSELQAASPAYETARLFRIAGAGVEVLRGFALVLVLAAGLSLFIALYNALEERRSDLAVLRTLGARPAQLMALMMLEGVLLALAGALLGLALGHALTGVLGNWLAAEQGIVLTGFTWLGEELALLVLALLVGVLAAVLPAWAAYRTDIAKTLSDV